MTDIAGIVGAGQLDTDSMDAADPLTPGYDAVLLAGFGGPEGPDDVMRFLRNVTRGRGIPEERLVEVSHHYQALGGSSPINEQNRLLRAALEAELTRRGISLPVLWGNRNWAPYLADTITAAHADGQRRLLGVATSAYSSYSSCRQYREDFGLALSGTGLVGSVRIDKVRPYFDRPGFRLPFAEGTVDAARRAIAAGLDIADLEIVFTTHSIPVTMADTSGSAELDDHRPGGAYVTQHLAVARAVIEHVTAELGSSPSWQLAYQSRSGPPSMPWLDPDINDVIDDLAAAGRRGVVVVPIGFVSDHVGWCGIWTTRPPRPPPTMGCSSPGCGHRALSRALSPNSPTWSPSVSGWGPRTTGRRIGCCPGRSAGRISAPAGAASTREPPARPPRRSIPPTTGPISASTRRC